MGDNSELQQNIRILVDAMFGKFGVWLRMLGFDCEIANPEWDDSTVMKFALDTKRSLITRDLELYHRFKQKITQLSLTKFKVCYIPHQQRTKVLAGFFLCFQLSFENYIWEIGKALPFTPRCSICNSELKSVEKSKILSKIPSGTANHYSDFWLCSNPDCSKVFWRGNHWRDVLKMIHSAQQLVNHSNPKILYQC